LGNQLWAYSNIFVLAKECKSSVCVVLRNDVYPFLDIQSLTHNTEARIHIYKDTSTTGKLISWLCRFFVLDSGKKKLFMKMLFFLPVTIEKNYKEETLFKNDFKKHRWYFINSWENRINKKYFIQNNSFVRELILPERSIRSLAEKKIQALRQKYKMLIAVHIRRGDYKYFLDGKFFFDDDVYRSYMLQMKNFFQNEDALFYIFSNEEIDINNYQGLHVHFDNSQAAAGDMWSMANCDYIIGPVSTFSMWASFWKQVPLYFIKGPNQDISKNNFRPVIAQDVFADGTAVEV